MPKCDAEPDTSNICNVSVGDRAPTMEGFCSFVGPAGNSHREEYCDKISTAGEWGKPHTVLNDCAFNGCNNYQDIGLGCCSVGCCGVPLGGGLQCERLSFAGDPVTCCFNDYACTAGGNNSACWSDADRQRTCADGKNGQPNYRSVISTDCQDVFTQYCTGTLPSDNPNSTEWMNRWTVNDGGEGSCRETILRNMFDLGGTGHCFTPPPINNVDCSVGLTGPIDAEGYFWAQSLVTATMNRYAEQGFALGSLPGDPGFNPFEDFLYSGICCPYPGLCQDGLDTACETYTAQRISLDPAISQWCGCHLPAGEYETYSSRFNIPPQCTPMCNRFGTVPIVGINAEPVLCEQNICLIDDVTVNIVQSQIGGGIDFNQICANCPGGQCSCIVSNTTIDIDNSTIGGNVVPVAEGCGSISCTQSNPGVTGPAQLPVACSGTGSINPYAEFEAETAAAEAAANQSSLLWTIAIIGVGLILIFLIIWLLHPNKYPHTGATVNRTPVNTNTQFSPSTDPQSINAPLQSTAQLQFSPGSTDSRNFSPGSTSTRNFSPTTPYNSIFDR